MLLVCVLSAAAACAQEKPVRDEPKWSSRLIAGPESGTSVVELSLQGSYSRPPSFVNAQPALVVECTKGKVRGNYISFGAILDVPGNGASPFELIAFIDDVRTPIVVDDVSPDHTSAYFSRRELLRMLNARQVVVGTVEFAGPPIQVRFTIPDSSPVLSACGHDWVLRQK